MPVFTGERIIVSPLSQVGIADDEPSDGEKTIDLGAGQLPERLPVPASCPLDEIRAHRDRRSSSRLFYRLPTL